MFGAGVGGFDQFAVVKVVILVHAVEEENSRFGMVVGGFHDLIPQIACAHLAVNPLAVVALVGAGRFHFAVRFGAVGELDFSVVLDGLHERVCDADRDIEIGQIAFVFGVDEDFNVRVVAAQHAHLRATPGAGGFDGFTGAVKDAHIGHRAGGTRLCALDLGALWPDRREVIADTTAPAHCFSGFSQGRIDAGLAVYQFDDGVADRLHKAIDQRGG